MRRGTFLAVTIAMALAVHTPWAAAMDVAITFDDLPGGDAEIRVVLHTLERHGYKGVPGFVNGAQIAGHNGAAQSLERWVVAGQRLGNHTFSHPDLWHVSTEAYLDDVRRNERVLEAASGERQSWKIFRYPFLFEGRTKAEYRQVRAALHAAGYTVAQVTIDPYDWAWDSAFNRCRKAGDVAGAAAVQAAFVDDALAQMRWAAQAAQAMFGRPIKHILLLHIRSLAAATLPSLLDAFVAAGVRFVPIEEALADPAYDLETARTGPVNGTFLRQVMRAHPIYDIPAPPPHPMATMDNFCADPAVASPAGP